MTESFPPPAGDSSAWGLGAPMQPIMLAARLYRSGDSQPDTFAEASLGWLPVRAAAPHALAAACQRRPDWLCLMPHR